MQAITEYHVTYQSPSGETHTLRTDDYVAALGRVLRIITADTPPPVHQEVGIGWMQTDTGSDVGVVTLVRYISTAEGRMPVTLLTAYHPAHGDELARRAMEPKPQMARTKKPYQRLDHE